MVNIDVPEADVKEAIMEPMSQAQTAAAGPPRLKGTPKVAG
jgi:hypothetical protein